VNLTLLNSSLLRPAFLAILWIGFGTYAFVFAPPDSPDTLDLIVNLSSGKFEGVNPLVANLFNIMGILPLMYCCLLYCDGRGQKLPAWLFSAGSFALGAFALLPYLILRKDNPTFVGKKNWVIKLWDSKITASLIAVAALSLLFLGLTRGDWADFAVQWRSSRFIHVMSLDFCMLSCLFPTLIKDDMLRRGWEDDRILVAVSLVPLFGPLVYLLVRPSLPESQIPNQVVLATDTPSP
jgi:hypothetical protein